MSGDEYEAEAARSERSGGATAALGKRCLRIYGRGSERRNDAQAYRHQDRDAERKGENGQIHRDVIEAGEIRRRKRQKGIHTPNGQQAPKPTAGERQDQGLGEKLANQPASARTQGRADGQLALAGRRARKHEIGHIGASNQKQEADSAEQHQQGRTDARGQRASQRDQANIPHINLGLVLFI